MKPINAPLKEGTERITPMALGARQRST